MANLATEALNILAQSRKWTAMKICLDKNQKFYSCRHNYPHMPPRPAPRPNKHKPTPAPRSKITLPPNTPKNYKPKKI